MTNARSFRKKPVVIQALQWDGTLSGIDDILSVFTDIRTVAKTSHKPTNKCSYWRIGTLEGGHEVSAGDFIIRGVKGEYYPCKPDVFAMTYDPEPAALPAQPAVPSLSVVCGPMPETNGKSNFTAILCRDGNVSDGFTIARSEYPDRVQYDADCVRFIIGELSERPNLLDYDGDKHSGYVDPPAQPAVPEGYTPVRTEVLLWLLGENGDFECPPAQYFRGKPAPYFWRKRLRESMLSAPVPAQPAVPEGVVRDAERYRFLRDCMSNMGTPQSLVLDELLGQIDELEGNDYSAALDGAIDAAMLSASQRKEGV